MDRIDTIVAQWKSELPFLDTAAMALVGRLQRITSAFRPLLDRVHGDSGLSGESFDVLASLRRSGAPYQLTPTALYREMMLSSGAMTNRIDRLEERGLVKRKADPDDRRGTLVCLTAKGKTLIEAAAAKHVQNEKALLDEALTAAEQKQLDMLLRKLLANLEARL